MPSCKNFNVDKDIPVVTNPNATEDNSNIVFNATLDDRSGTKYYYFSDYNVNMCSSNSYLANRTTILNNNEISKSINESKVWALYVEDNAGNCGIASVFQSFIGNYNNQIEVNKNVPIDINTKIFNIKDRKLCKSDIDQVTANCSYENNKLNIKLGNPIANPDTITSTQLATVTAKSRPADTKKGSCDYTCPKGGTPKNGVCVNDNYTLTSYFNNVKYYCTCNGIKCTLSYKTAPCTGDCNKNCKSGYTKGSAVRHGTDYNYKSCSINQASTTYPAVTASYYFTASCKWNNYNATCNRDTIYYCGNGEYKSGTKCYFCSDTSQTLNKKICQYYPEINTYDYGNIYQLTMLEVKP